MKNKKILLYALFAIIATIINLISQRLILSISTNNLFFFLAIFWNFKWINCKILSR